MNENIFDNISEWLLEVAIWIMIPTFQFTKNNRHKSIRVLGLLGVYILFPFFILGIPIIIMASIAGLSGVLVQTFKEI